MQLLLEHDRQAALLTPPQSWLASQTERPCFSFGLRGLHTALRAHQPDLIVAHSSRAHDLALLQCRRPIVVHRRVDFRRRSLKYQAVQGFVAVSWAVRDVLIEGGVDPRRVEVVQDALPPRTPAEDTLERPSGLLVLGACALVPHKDPQTLVHATALAGARLWLAGKGPLAPTLGADHVRLLGWRADLGRLLRTADVFVLSSQEEGFGSVLLEARRAGIPIVVTRAGGAPEAAGPDALQVAPRDAPALARAIRRAAQHPRRPDALPEHHPERVWEKTLAAYQALLAV